MSITKQTTIENLVEKHPSSLRFLSDKGIQCIGRGEPVLGTIESLAMDTDLSESMLNQILKDLNNMTDN